jgi:hypothetical protein
MAVALCALFVALGGSSYAALSLPKNSVKARQIASNAVGAAEIKSGAVRSAEVRNGSLLAKDFKAGQLPAGAKGDKGDPGAKGEKGDRGPSFGSAALNNGVTQTGCDQTTAIEYPITITEPTRISVSGMASFQRLGADDNIGLLYAWLRDSTTAIVAATQIARANPASANDLDEVPMTFSSLLFAGGAFPTAPAQPFVAAPGAYTLQLQVDNTGICVGSARYSNIAMTHILLGNG